MLAVYLDVGSERGADVLGLRDRERRIDHLQRTIAYTWKKKKTHTHTQKYTIAVL
jgi:hypothetical protein